MSDLLSDALQLHGNGFVSTGIKAPNILPDIAEDSVAHVGGTLERVGMSGVETLVRITDDRELDMSLPAKADAFVSLDDDKAKGIHMSRLFLTLQDHIKSPWSPVLVDEVLRQFVAHHESISFSAYLSTTFQLPVRRKALLSGHEGWRHYPVRTESILANGKCRHWLTVGLTYSSTCPCSAALSRQLIQKAFAERFDGRASIDPEEAIAWLGTPAAIAGQPHSQRSHADVTIELESADHYPVTDLIDQMEAALKTPVQTAVKRIDEQEFARLNAEQLMFCEDAARILAAELRSYDAAADFRVRVEHLESLHAHDAVAVVTQGKPGGLRP